MMYDLVAAAVLLILAFVSIRWSQGNSRFAVRWRNWARRAQSDLRSRRDK